MFHSWLTEAPIIGLHKPTTMLFAVAFFLRRYHFFFFPWRAKSLILCIERRSERRVCPILSAESVWS